MVTYAPKYNPGFQEDEELIRTFVVRHKTLDLLLDTVRANTGNANQHLLVVGPRGVGKTTLVRRAAAEIRVDEQLGVDWYPLVFAEESYEVLSAGEFWLEALFHLADQTEGERWRLTYEELRDEQDEVRLRERAMAQLMDFADAEGKRIMLIVENLNILLGEQLKDEDDWALRHALMNEPRLMLMGTATVRFEKMESENKAWFELFRTVSLPPLNRDEARELWRSVSGDDIAAQQIRPIQILTGGSPRLLRIVAEFAAKRSFGELMDDLIYLIDSHTDYFKSQLDHLAASERKVFVALLNLWDPATSHEVARDARMAVTNASALLHRLVERGAVVVVASEGRKKWFQVAERLYNIYYLARRRGHPSNRVRVIVSFMVQFYSQEKLVEISADLAREVEGLAPERKGDLYLAYKGIYEALPELELRTRLIEATPDVFFQGEDTPEEISDLQQGLKIKQFEELESASRRLLGLNVDDAYAWNDLGVALFFQSRYDEAELAYRKALDLNVDDASALNNLGSTLSAQGQYDEAGSVLRQSLDINPNNRSAWYNLGIVLGSQGRHDEAESAYRKSLDLNADDASVWSNLGAALGSQGRHDEAESAYRKSLDLNANDASAWSSLGAALFYQDQYVGAESAYRKVLDLNPNNRFVWNDLGAALDSQGRHDEAESAYRKSLDINADDASVWNNLGLALFYQDQYVEAESAYRKSLDFNADDASVWNNLGLALFYQDQYVEAESAYRKSLDFNADDASVWSSLGSALFYQGQYIEAESAYRKSLDLNVDDAFASGIWGSIGSALGNQGRYDEAEVAYYKSLDLNADSVLSKLCLMSVLGSQAKWEEGWTLLSEVLRIDLEDSLIQHFIDFSIGYSTGGKAQKLLDTIIASPAAPQFEALTVGLRLYLGEQPKVAQEILEVGKDVAERIRQRAEAVQTEATT